MSIMHNGSSIQHVCNLYHSLKFNCAIQRTIACSEESLVRVKEQYGKVTYHLNNIVFAIERNIRGIILLYNIAYMYIRPQYVHSSVRTAMTQCMENSNKQFMFSSPLNMFSGQASWHVGLHQSEPGSTLFDRNATQVPLSAAVTKTRLRYSPRGI